MAQHDYVLENASGALFRQDLNNALKAIAENNMGATAPTTTYAGMWWLDTSTSPATLRIRNNVNTAWISCGNLNEMSYLAGVTSGIQAQLNAKASKILEDRLGFGVNGATYVVNIDTTLDVGNYAFNAGSIGAPCSYGTLSVFFRAAGELTQLVIDNSTGDAFVRGKTSGFTPWRKLVATRDFVASLSGNGYQALPSGLIVQWGTSTASSAFSGTSTIVILPISFVSACVTAVATNTGSVVGNSTYNTTAKSVSSFTVQRGNNQNHETGTSFNWLAIGY